MQSSNYQGSDAMFKVKNVSSEVCITRVYFSIEISLEESKPLVTEILRFQS